MTHQELQFLSDNGFKLNALMNSSIVVVLIFVSPFDEFRIISITNKLILIVENFAKFQHFVFTTLPNLSTLSSVNKKKKRRKETMICDAENKRQLWLSVQNELYVSSSCLFVSTVQYRTDSPYNRSLIVSCALIS